MVIRDLVQLFGSKERFMGWVEKYNRKHGQAYETTHYPKLMAYHRKGLAYQDIVSNPDFLQQMHHTLCDWDMNRRTARLVEFEVFEHSVRRLTGSLTSLSKYQMENLTDERCGEVLRQLSALFNGLAVMKSSSRIVGVSKTLHFLLPDLVPPIDRRRVLKCLFGSPSYYRELPPGPCASIRVMLPGDVTPRIQREFNKFGDILFEYTRLSRHVGLSKADVDGKGWNTSVPKLIDNAVIAVWENEEES